MRLYLHLGFIASIWIQFVVRHICTLQFICFHVVSWGTVVLPSDIFQLNSCSDITSSALCLFYNLPQKKCNGMCSSEQGDQEIGPTLSINLFGKWAVSNCCCKLLKCGSGALDGRWCISKYSLTVVYMRGETDLSQLCFWMYTTYSYTPQDRGIFWVAAFSTPTRL
jgi:hypothetical protein